MARHPTEEAPSALFRVLGATRADIPECVGVGLVNMHSGVVLAQHSAGPESAEALDLAAAAAAELFEGRDVLAVEGTFNRLREAADRRASRGRNALSGEQAAGAAQPGERQLNGSTASEPTASELAASELAASELAASELAATEPVPRDRFREVIILSGEQVLVFQRGKRDERLVLVVLSRVTANLSLVLTKARRVVDVVEDIASGEIGR